MFSDQPKFELLFDGFVEDLTGAELDVHSPDGGTQLYAAVAATVDILLRDNQCQHDNVMLQIVSDGNDDSCRQSTPTHHLHAELLQTALDALESFDRRFKGSGLVQFFTTQYGADSAQKLVRPEQLTIIEEYRNSGLHKGHHASRPRRHFDIISLPYIRNMSIPSTVDETEREGDADRREFQMREAETFSDGYQTQNASKCKRRSAAVCSNCRQRCVKNKPLRSVSRSVGRVCNKGCGFVFVAFLRSILGDKTYNKIAPWMD